MCKARLQGFPGGETNCFLNLNHAARLLATGAGSRAARPATLLPDFDDASRK
jgi:hypothetical protein